MLIVTYPSLAYPVSAMTMQVHKTLAHHTSDYPGQDSKPVLDKMIIDIRGLYIFFITSVKGGQYMLS
jgi:hypothetical protein